MEYVILTQRNDDPVMVVMDGTDGRGVHPSKAAAVKALMALAEDLEFHVNHPELYHDVDAVEYSADNTFVNVRYCDPGPYHGIKRIYWVAECRPFGKDVTLRPVNPEEKEAQFRSCGNCVNLASYMAKNLASCPLPSSLYKTEEEWAHNCHGWGSEACTACLLKNSHLVGKKDDKQA